MNDLDQFFRESAPSAILLLIDKNVKKYHADYLTKIPVEIPVYEFVITASEQNKSINTATEIWQYMLACKLDKNALLINFGGGITCDLGGFVAANYKRGIRFINIPTTLLSMIDAAIGGKNGVNMEHIKNSVGSFHFPQKIIYNTTFLQTLPQVEWESGFGELLKYALLANATIWEEIKSMESIHSDSIKKDWIDFSIHFKQSIVNKDPFEQHHRRLLNFGHTAGHALETLLLSKNRPVSHGHAVAIGLIIESYIAYLKDAINISTYNEIRSVILKFFEMPVLHKNDLNIISTLILNDKKSHEKGVYIPLLKEIGQVDSTIWIAENIFAEALQVITEI
jgi:3-dehydroquinate synthase